MRYLLSLGLVFTFCASGFSKDVELFNGKDLSGWTWISKDGKSKVEDVWSASDGVLHCKGNPVGYLRTNDDYTSYVLKVQWRTIKAGNGGVLLRISGEDKVWPRCIEAQLQTNDAGDAWNIGDFPMKVDPARTEGRRTKKLHPTNEKRLGEWNEYEITLDGGHLTLKVNGEVQNEASDCEIIAGKIGLQSEGAEMEYRNITLTPIEQKQSTANEKPMQQLAIDLYESLTPDQRKQALLPLDDPARKEERFTPGKRAGVMLKDLSAPQRNLAMLLVTRFTSDYGAEKCKAIAAQPGNAWEKHCLAFFGEPGPGKTYAWRIAEHHLTIVHVEVENGTPTTFGPILLGADPPVLWNDDEDKMISLFTSLSPAEREKVDRPGKAQSSAPLGAHDGVGVSSLSQTAQAKAKEVLDNRLKFFAPEIQKRVQEMIEKQGGVGGMRVAFYGNADKRAADGGKWDFKLGGGAFLCDYENSRGHIHMSMKGRLVEAKSSD